MRDEMFDSAVRAAGDLAGVFEYDGETGYFYLSDGHKIIGAIHVFSGEPDLADEDVAVWWDASGKRVGLFIRGVLWAAFDEDRTPHGGRYKPGATSPIPWDASTWLGTTT